MKKVLFSFFILLTMFSCQQKNETQYVEVVTHTSGPMMTGDEVGNGGDNITVHFKAAVYDVIHMLENDDSIDLDESRLKDMLEGNNGERLVIAVTDEKLYDKNKELKEALNFPNGKAMEAKPFVNLSRNDLGQPLIVLKKSAWERHIRNNIDLSLLVFHEVSPILGKLDDDGKMSESFKKLITERNRQDSIRARGNRFETTLPERGYLTSILTDRDLVEGLLALDKKVVDKLGIDEALGQFVFDIEVYKVDRLRGYYRILRNERFYTKTSTYAYPVELDNGETKLILEVKNGEFEKEELKERILDAYVAMVYLRDENMSVIEMEEVIKTAIEITECEVVGNVNPFKSLQN